MRIQKAMLIFRKDWREVKRNWQVTLPMVVVPLFFSVLLPIIITVFPNFVGTTGASISEFEPLIKRLPIHIQRQIGSMTPQQTMIYIIGLYFFAPLFLIIPIMASSVIASDSFAGEKERRTIEALLATPISDGELFLGKILVSFVPSMIVTVISFLIYSVLFDVLSLNVFNGAVLLPNLDWLLLIFGLAPTMALTSVGLTVMISAKVKGVREAQQISAILLIPIFALIFGQIAGAMILGSLMILALIGLFAVIDIIMFKIGVKLFGREEILSKLA